MIILIEGADGVGKSTTISLLMEKLKKNGIDVRLTIFPTRKGLKVPHAFIRDFRENFPWKDANNDNIIHIIDRMWLSTVAYQNMDIDFDTVFLMNILPIDRIYVIEAHPDFKAEILSQMDAESIEIIKRVTHQKELKDGYYTINRRYLKLSVQLRAELLQFENNSKELSEQIYNDLLKNDLIPKKRIPKDIAGIWKRKKGGKRKNNWGFCVENSTKFAYLSNSTQTAFLNFLNWQYGSSKTKEISIEFDYNYYFISFDNDDKSFGTDEVALNAEFDLFLKDKENING